MDGDESELRGASTSRRVVSGRRGGGPSLWLVVVVVAVLAGAGVILTRDDGDEAASDRRDGQAAEPPSGAEMEVVKSADVSAAYATAAVRFGRAPTRSATAGPCGARARARCGPARRAPGPDGLAGAAWEAVGGVDQNETGWVLPQAPASRLGIALVADAVQAAADRREAPRDEAGRRVIRATVPDRMSRRNAGPEDLDDLIGGAELAVTLDDGGDIARVELTSAPGHPMLDLALDIVRLGDPDLVVPADLARPIRGSVPADVLAGVGLGSLDVPGLPDGWALTNASVDRPDGAGLGTVPPGCGGPFLSFEYHDLRAVADGLLSLSASSDTCDPDDGIRVGTGGFAEYEFTAGRFSGLVSPSTGDPYRGTVTDGTTAVSFTTDLSGEDAATALASLVPAASSG